MAKGALWLAILAAIGTTALIWIVAQVTKPTPSVSYSQRRTHVICHLKEDLSFTSEKVCIYDCEDGQKSKVEGVRKCLPRLDLE